MVTVNSIENKSAGIEAENSVLLHTNEAVKSSVNPVFDIVKFIMAIAVVAIHANVLPGILHPWLRIAVPMFFIISSYLFFTKLNKVSLAGGNTRKVMLNFIKRNLILYLFWFVVLSPLTFYMRSYFSRGILYGLYRILKAFLLTSTFVASWYIMATVIGTLLVFLASKRLSNRVLFAVTLLIHIAISLWSAHYPLISNIKFVPEFTAAYVKVLAHPWNNFMVSLFWIVCGKCFAEETIRLKKNISIPVLIVSAVLLYLEWMVSKNSTGVINNDSFIFLAPVCVSLFAIIKDIKVKKVKNTINLRKASVIIYPLHGSVVLVTSKLSNIFLGASTGYSRFILTLIFCFAACWVILRLEKTKMFSWLKYSH